MLNFHLFSPRPFPPPPSPLPLHIRPLELLPLARAFSMAHYLEGTAGFAGVQKCWKRLVASSSHTNTQIPSIPGKSFLAFIIFYHFADIKSVGKQQVSMLLIQFVVRELHPARAIPSETANRRKWSNEFVHLWNALACYNQKISWSIKLQRRLKEIYWIFFCVITILVVCAVLILIMFPISQHHGWDVCGPVFVCVKLCWDKIRANSSLFCEPTLNLCLCWCNVQVHGNRIQVIWTQSSLSN